MHCISHNQERKIMFLFVYNSAVVILNSEHLRGKTKCHQQLSSEYFTAARFSTQMTEIMKTVLMIQV